MPSLTFVLPDDSRVDVDVETGTSVMQAAVNHGIDLIVAECGGSMSCATCHVYVEGDLDRLPEVDAMEEEMLECTAAPRLDNSRLSCQLVLSDVLDGLVVRLPAEQV